MKLKAKEINARLRECFDGTLPPEDEMAGITAWLAAGNIYIVRTKVEGNATITYGAKAREFEEIKRSADLIKEYGYIDWTNKNLGEAWE